MTFPNASINGRTVVITESMQMAAATLPSLIPEGNIAVWYGNPGTGKTTTAEWVTSERGAKSLGISAFYCTPSPGGPGAGSGKRLLREILKKVGGARGGSTSDRRQLDELHDDTLAALRIANVELLFLDEAGELHREAITTLVHLRDKALGQGQRLAIVLMGMRGIAQMILGDNALERRIRDFHEFRNYSQDEFTQFIDSLVKEGRFMPFAKGQAEAILKYLFDESLGNLNSGVAMLQRAQSLCTLADEVSISRTAVTAAQKHHTKSRASIGVTGSARGRV